REDPCDALIPREQRRERPARRQVADLGHLGQDDGFEQHRERAGGGSRADVRQLGELVALGAHAKFSTSDPISSRNTGAPSRRIATPPRCDSSERGWGVSRTNTSRSSTTRSTSTPSLKPRASSTTTQPAPGGTVGSPSRGPRSTSGSG